MIILVVPMLSQRNLNSDSNYVIMREVIPQILHQRPDWLFDILWPSNTGDWRYYKDGFFDHPNIRRTPMYLDSNKMRQVVSFDPRAWQKLLGFKDVIYDVIWNNTVEIGDLIKYFEPRYVPNAMSRVVNFHHYVLHDTLNYPVKKTYEHVLMRQIFAALTVDTNVTNSDHCRQMLLDNAEYYCGEDTVKRLESTMTKISYGTLDPERMDRLAAPRHETFTFAYNHRLQDYKQWRKTFAMYDQLAQHHTFRVQVHGSIANDKLVEIAGRPYVDVVDTPDHDDYLTALSRCHANLTNSVHETFCVAAVESMAYSQAFIAPNGVTFPEITGATENNYPLLFTPNDDNAQYALLEKLVTDVSYTEECGRIVAEWVRGRYTSEATARNIVNLFESETRDAQVVPTLKRPEVWKTLLREQTVWSIDDLRRRAYAAVSSAGKHIAAGQSFPAVKIKRLANELGYRDTWGNDGRLHLVKD